LGLSNAHPDHRSASFGSPGREPVELVWRDTWHVDGPLDDNVAEDNGVTVARALCARGAHHNPETWKWSGFWFVRRPDGMDWAPGGHCQSRREAMLAVEDAHNRWRAVREIDPARK
jgi:hypothetical protein